jgi:hypothetical protein
MANKTFVAFVDKQGGTTATNYIGSEGELFYDPTTTTLRVSDGSTPGGSVVSGGGGDTGNITFTNTTMSPPDGENITISAVNSEVQITGTDFRVDVTDDVRIQGSDLVSLRNISNTDPITIVTDYNDSAYVWRFGEDGSFQIPGDTTVAGQITGTSGSGTLVLVAEPESNTYIQLNDTVDSIIAVSANLEIRTNTSGTNKVWVFGQTGEMTFPVLTVADLSSIGTTAGKRVFVNDSNLVAIGNFGEIVAGGGANTVPVYSDGSNWRIG